MTTCSGQIISLAGRDVYELTSDALRLWCLPDLGGRVLRLEDRRTGRNWLWHPGDDPRSRLWTNSPTDPFDASPLAGIDECSPTVAPCEVDGVAMPDHGELWHRPWNVEAFEPAIGRLRTSVRLESRPLRFVRELILAGEILRLTYRVENRTDKPIKAIWSLHPLLRIHAGDRIEGVPPCCGRIETAAGISGLAADQIVAWPEPVRGVSFDRFHLDDKEAFVKLFIPNPGKPIHFTSRSGERMTWTAGPLNRLPYFGIWITRGGWNGYHHAAIEPTNAPHDRLDRVRDGQAHIWPAHQCVAFEVTITCSATATAVGESIS